jgi:hypothetical protein
MRGGEVLGGYGYAERDEYSKARGELIGIEVDDPSSGESGAGQSQEDTQT